MRFAHISDTHLGYRQYNLDEREEDFYNAFHEAVDKSIAEKCDFVIHSGDLFDEPRPHIRAMVEVRKAFDRILENEIPFFTIAGNHDILMRRGAMIPHALYKGIEVLTPKNPWRELEGIFIAGLPYHSKIHANALKESLKELSKKAESYEKKILILHQGIDKFFGLEYELKIGDLPQNFNYYALGHIHKRLEDTFGGGMLVYPGSTEIWRTDEVQDYEKNGKGFVIVDTSDFSIQRVNLECIRPFIKTEINSELEIEEFKKKIAGKKKPVLQVTVTSNAERYQGVYQELLRELGRDILYLDIKRKRVEEEAEKLVSERAFDIRELLNVSMKTNTELERDFAYSLFTFLSSGKLDDAAEYAEEFYKSWSSNQIKLEDKSVAGSQKTEPKETFQKNLEAF